LHGNFIPKIGCHYFWPELIEPFLWTTLPIIILLNIENNKPFLTFSLILLNSHKNLPKPITHLTINSLTLDNPPILFYFKIQTTQSSNFIGQNIFFSLLKKKPKVNSTAFVYFVH
jgi:hypothetical protein